MILSQIYELCNYISGRFTAGYSIPPARFNLVLPESQDIFYSNRLAAKDWDSLRPFRKTIGDDTMGLGTIGGIADLPSDYHAGGDGYYMMGDEPVGINFVDNEQQWTDLIRHKIEFPTLEYPIGLIQGSRVKFRPKQVNHVVFSYLTRPPVPYLDFCQSASNPNRIIYMPVGSEVKERGTQGVFDLILADGTLGEHDVTVEPQFSQGRKSRMVELAWPEITHWRLLYLVLQKCGVNLSEDTVLKWSMEMSKV